MPANRMTMRKIKEVLRLKWACGLSHRQISSHTRCGTAENSRLSFMLVEIGKPMRFVAKRAIWQVGMKMPCSGHRSSLK